ncbi:MAG TPA: hypothetical protein VE046_13840 [Steroidobacteraceae bacterium]|nr:hypothetical protein [Steroidobacteraceae bacterium]
MSNFMKALLATGLPAVTAAPARTSFAEAPQLLAEQVRAAETAFAKSMADRDFAAFGRVDPARFFWCNGERRR